MEFKSTNYDVITQELTETTLSQKDIDIILKKRAEMEQIEAEIQAKATAKAALLAQLGITEEQAKLLLS
jgi:hypothetical protein